MVYNESVVLLDFGNRLEFEFSDANLKLSAVVEFVFSPSGEKYQSNVKVSEDGKRVTVTLFQWDSDPYGHIEVTQPLNLNTKDGKRVSIKYRTQSHNKSGFRNFHITVWAEENAP
jgi:hypothetical protein